MTGFPHVQIRTSSRRADALKGAELRILAGINPCPFGECLIARSDLGICHLSLFDPGGAADAIAGLMNEWPGATIVRDDPGSADLTRRIFHRTTTASDHRILVIHLRGTPFQLAVWKVLLGIPPGETLTYREVAAAAGHPGATRAAGTAIGCNEVSILIPCHRVVRADGATGGYRWGAERKASILKWEQNIGSPNP